MDVTAVRAGLVIAPIVLITVGGWLCVYVSLIFTDAIGLVVRWGLKQIAQRIQ